MREIIRNRGKSFDLICITALILGLIIFGDIPPAYGPGRFCPAEELDEGCSNIGAAEAGDVEVEREVEELQVVGHSSEQLEAVVVVELLCVDEREDGGRGGAHQE